MKRLLPGQQTLSLRGPMALVPAARSPLAAPPAAGILPALDALVQQEKRARTAEPLDAEQQTCARAATVVKTETKPKIQKASGFIFTVCLKLRVVSGTTSIATDVSICKLAALAAAGVSNKRIVYKPAEKSTIICKTSSLKPAEALVDGQQLGVVRAGRREHVSSDRVHVAILPTFYL